MKIDKDKLADTIDNLNSINEYLYITYHPSDEERAQEILKKLYELSEEWSNIHDDNYSY